MLLSQEKKMNKLAVALDYFEKQSFTAAELMLAAPLAGAGLGQVAGSVDGAIQNGWDGAEAGGRSGAYAGLATGAGLGAGVGGTLWGTSGSNLQRLNRLPNGARRNLLLGLLAALPAMGASAGYGLMPYQRPARPATAK